MKFILASSNAGKAKELLATLGDINIDIEPASEKLEVEEDGKTFYENALKKAASYFEKFQKPTVSDDSGLVVEALPSELGVHSARFAEHLTDYKDKCTYLLNRLEEVGADYRGAYFVSVLCFYFGADDYFFFEGRLKGSIGHELIGEQGFGYDPIFIPEGESFTLAENVDWKKTHSHRAKALSSAKTFLAGHLKS